MFTCFSPVFEQPCMCSMLYYIHLLSIIYVIYVYIYIYMYAMCIYLAYIYIYMPCRARYLPSPPLNLLSQSQNFQVRGQNFVVPSLSIEQSPQAMLLFSRHPTPPSNHYLTRRFGVGQFLALGHEFLALGHEFLALGHEFLALGHEFWP